MYIEAHGPVAGARDAQDSYVPLGSAGRGCWTDLFMAVRMWPLGTITGCSMCMVQHDDKCTSSDATLLLGSWQRQLNVSFKYVTGLGYVHLQCVQTAYSPLLLGVACRPLHVSHTLELCIPVEVRVAESSGRDAPTCLMRGGQVVAARGFGQVGTGTACASLAVASAAPPLQPSADVPSWHKLQAAGLATASTADAMQAGEMWSNPPLALPGQQVLHAWGPLLGLVLHSIQRPHVLRSHHTPHHISLDGS